MRSNLGLLLAFITATAACAPSAGTVDPRSATRATATLRDTAGAEVGVATFTQERDGAVRLEAEVTGLPPGAHGIHVHTTGSCDAAGATAFGAAGGHFNPTARPHGLRHPQGGHLGDLPNLDLGDDGRGELRTTSTRFTLSPGAASLLDADGSALVIHAGPDDQRTDPTGNSGGRIACGVVEPG